MVYTIKQLSNWAGYTAEQKKRIFAESGEIYTDLVAAMGKGYANPEVQTLIARWHQHLRYFYEPTIEILREAITYYCDRL